VVSACFVTQSRQILNHADNHRPFISLLKQHENFYGRDVEYALFSTGRIRLVAKIGGDIMLTRMQDTLLALINEQIQRTGDPLDLETMRQKLGVESMTAVRRLVAALEERGLVARSSGRANAFHLLR
jgi:DNA-binding MarR family transcriptional regulator